MFVVRKRKMYYETLTASMVCFESQQKNDEHTFFCHIFSRKQRSEQFFPQSIDFYAICYAKKKDYFNTLGIIIKKISAIVGLCLLIFHGENFFAKSSAIDARSKFANEIITNKICFHRFRFKFIVSSPFNGYQ